MLEALNRLLDSNRQLLVPDVSSEPLTPHPGFVLFATQNPPGQFAVRLGVVEHECSAMETLYQPLIA